MVFGFRKMKTVLVFGGTGFLGSYLVKYLLLKEIRVIVYIHKNIGLLKDFKHTNLYDIDSLDVDNLVKMNILTIYHLASKQTAMNPSYNEFYDGNVIPTINILELAKKLKIGHIIYTSTSNVFSKNIEMSLMNELMTPNPFNYYGLTKYISEKILEIESSREKLKNCVIRFPSIYGINCGGGIVDTLYSHSKKNEKIELYSNGERLRNLIYIESAVEILYLAMLESEKLKNFEIFMAGSSDSMRLIDIAKLIVSATNSSSEIIPVDKFSPLDFDVNIDTAKAEKILGFKPLSIANGIKKYIEEMKDENL